MILPDSALDVNGTLCPGLGTGHDLLMVNGATHRLGHAVGWVLYASMMAVSVAVMSSAL